MKSHNFLNDPTIGPELDYAALIQQLSSYKNPRDQITRLLKSGQLIRVKKGLYVLNPKWSHRPYSLEVLANLVYGPSYLSFESALQFYGLIPERVEEVSSMTCQRKKRFETPVGIFSYTYCPQAYYSVGVTQQQLATGQSILIATPEKALADQLRRGEPIRDIQEMRTYLLDNLRVDEEGLKQLKIRLLQRIAEYSKHASLPCLIQCLREL